MENTTENRVAVISIIVEQPQCVNEINEILHSASEYIIGRMGIPYREKNINIIILQLMSIQRPRRIRIRTTLTYLRWNMILHLRLPEAVI